MIFKIFLSALKSTVDTSLAELIDTLFISTEKELGRTMEDKVLEEPIIGEDVVVPSVDLSVPVVVRVVDVIIVSSGDIIAELVVVDSIVVDSGDLCFIVVVGVVTVVIICDDALSGVVIVGRLVDVIMVIRGERVVLGIDSVVTTDVVVIKLVDVGGADEVVVSFSVVLVVGATVVSFKSLEGAAVSAADFLVSALFLLVLSFTFTIFNKEMKEESVRFWRLFSVEISLRNPLIGSTVVVVKILGVMLGKVEETIVTDLIPDLSPRVRLVVAKVVLALVLGVLIAF